jgi:hypothetical protein
MNIVVLFVDTTFASGCRMSGWKQPTLNGGKQEGLTVRKTVLPYASFTISFSTEVHSPSKKILE